MRNSDDTQSVENENVPDAEYPTDPEYRNDPESEYETKTLIRPDLEDENEDNLASGEEDGLNVHFEDEFSDLELPGEENPSLFVRDTDQDSGNGSVPGDEYFLPEPPDGGYGWVICACAFIHQMIADGLLFSFGVLYISLLDHFKCGSSEATWVGAVMMGTSMISGPLVGAVASRYSLRTAGLIGSLVAAAGLVASYFAPSIFLLTISYGVVTGLGVGFLFLTSILAVSVYFRKRRALANGIAMCGSGVGVFVLSPVLEALLEYYGWQGSMLVLAGFALQGCVVACFYRQLPPQTHQEMNNSQASSDDSGIGPLPNDRHDHKSESGNKLLSVLGSGDFEETSLNVRVPSLQKLALSTNSLHTGYWENVAAKELSHLDLCQIGSMLTLPTVYSMKDNGLTHSRSAMTLDEKESYMFWRYQNYECSSLLTALWRTLNCRMMAKPTMLLLIIVSMLWTGQSTTFIFLVDYAMSVGVSRRYGALLISALGIANCIGRILVGFMTDSPRVNSSLVYAVSIGLAGCISFLIPFITSYAALMVLSTLLGFCIASYVSIRSIVVVDLMGVENLAGVLGLVVMFQGFAFTIVPPVSGAILEATSTFKGPFIASGACYLLAAVFMLPILFSMCKRHKWCQRGSEDVQVEKGEENY